MESWSWTPGNWESLVGVGELTHIGDVELDQISSPWSWNIHRHLNYDRLFWDIWRNGMKTPLLVRPWTFPPKSNRTNYGCTDTGKRLDNAPNPTYETPPKYELVIGNMRYCAIYTQGHKTAPCLMLHEYYWNKPVEEIWDAYHPTFEGNYYDHPDHQGPSKYRQGF